MYDIKPLIPHYITPEYTIPRTLKIQSGRKLNEKSLVYTDEQLDAAHDAYLQFMEIFREYGWDDQVVVKQPENHSRISNIYLKGYQEFTDELNRNFSHIPEDAATNLSGGNSWNYAQPKQQLPSKVITPLFTFQLQRGVLQNIALKKIDILREVMVNLYGEAANYKVETLTPEQFRPIFAELNRILAEQLESNNVQVTPATVTALMQSHIASARGVVHRQQVSNGKNPNEVFFSYLREGVTPAKALLFSSILFDRESQISAEDAASYDQVPTTWFLALYNNKTGK